MIGKKAPNPKKSSTKSGRVIGLTNYITAPENANALEKCVHYEASNFLTEDLQSQQVEMIALATTAVRSKDPIDHYVLSWQEGETPTIAQAREAVEMTMKHLGLEGHQVVWGLHEDTDNVHLHIAINRVHPETLQVVEVNKGFQNNAIQQAAAIIEKIQDWKVHEKARFKTDELGHLITDSKTKLPKVFKELEKKGPTGQAKDKEIQTGEKSAQRIGIEHAPAIIASAKSWADLHTKMQAAGMEYTRQGSGAAIKIGNTVVKASDVVDRKNNFGALQKRLGLYQTANQPEIKNDPHERTQLIDDNRFTTGYEEQDTAPARFNTFNALRHMSGSDLAKRPTTAKSKTTNKGLLQFDESASRGRTDGMRWRGDSDSQPRGAVANEKRERRQAGHQSPRKSIQEIAEKGEGCVGNGNGTGKSEGRREISVRERERERERSTGTSDSRVNTGANRSAGSSSRRESEERDISIQAIGREKGGKTAPVFHQRLNDQQHGWAQYQKIKKDNNLAKSAERLTLQKRHEAERTALYKSLKEHRETTLKAVKKGDGAALNLTRSLLAIEQAPQKLELQERQRAERKAFLAKYKPLPMYKIWKEKPFIVAPVDALHIEPRETQIRVSQTLRALTSTVDRHNNVTYQLQNKDVFRDEGRIIQILDLNSDEGIAAALAVAQQKFGNVLTLTGSQEFQKNAVAVAVANNLTCKFSDPALETLRGELQQQKYQAEKNAARAERERLATEQIEKSKEGAKAEALEKQPPASLHSPIQQTREAVPLDTGPLILDPIPTPAAHAEELRAFLVKHQDVPKATSAQVSYATVKESHGSMALLHLGQGRHVIHDFGTAQAVPPVGKAAGQKSSVERG